jgi:hypothetical protein
MKEDRKALQDSMEINNIKFQKDSMTEIKMEIKLPFKRSELDTQGLHREFLDRFDSETRECTHLISQVPKETEDKLTIDNQIIEENIEFIKLGITEACPENAKVGLEVIEVAVVIF